MKTWLRLRAAILRARVRRWWYLLTVGMWRGECAITYVDYHDRRRLVCLASGDTHAAHTGEEQRIWWEREGIEPWWRTPP